MSASRTPWPESPTSEAPGCGCTTTSFNWCPACFGQRLPRLQDRLLSPHPVPADRHLRASPLAVPGPGGPSRRRLSGFPDQAGGAQLRGRGGQGDHRCPGTGLRPRLRGRTVQLPGGPDLDRRRAQRALVPLRLTANTAAARIRSDLGNPDHVILGVDRLDYTKGIDLRLRAFEVMLDRHPELHGQGFDGAGGGAEPGGRRGIPDHPASGRGDGGADQRPIRPGGLGPGALPLPFARLRGAGRCLSVGRRDVDHPTPGRDEPGRPGIRGDPTRQHRGPDPQRVRRCRRAAGGCADREPLRPRCPGAPRSTRRSQ